jgi:serine/threonine protein kinase
MSPQQVLGKPATRVDDIYALGATIFDLLTSRPPFFRGDVFAHVLHEEAPSMTQRRQDLGVHGKAEIPRTWERAIAACLSKEPEARPASGAALLEMLREVELAPVGPIRVKVLESRSSVRVVTTRPESSPRREEAESRVQAIAKSTPEEHPAVRIVPPPLRFFRTQQTGVTKFFFNLVSVIVMAAIAAGTVHLARRTKSAKPAVAAQAAPTETEPTNRLGSSALDSGRKLQTSSLDAGAPQSGEAR